MDYNVILSEQDLADFLDDNASYMEQYRAELERRLATDGDTANVEISRDALDDKISEEQTDTVQAVMADMGNDWGWLKE